MDGDELRRAYHRAVNEGLQARCEASQLRATLARAQREVERLQRELGGIRDALSVAICDESPSDGA